MDIFTGLGLAAPAGLNAYIPLLTVGLLARFTDWVTLDAPWDLLASDAALIVLTIMLLIELFADAVPGLDSINDIAQTAIRPASGAILMMATTGEIFDMHPAIAAIIGIAVAGTVHGTKAVSRPAVTASTGGLGNPVVSTIENMTAVIMSIIAIMIPILIAIVGVIVFVVTGRWLLRRRRRSTPVYRQ